MLQEQIDNIIGNVSSNMQVDDYFLQDREINLLKNILKKEITLDDAIDTVKRSYRVE